MFKRSLFISLSFLSLMFSCGEPEASSTLKYSTGSEEALMYYALGWKQIMDEGRYGESEVTYRKALEADPGFLVGKSVLARLTLDLEERLKFYDELEKGKASITGDERLVLDVYIALTKFTNMRQQKDPDAQAALQEARDIAEENFRHIVHKYPDEVYMKAEYLEILHSNHGPEATLDTLDRIVLGGQKENPFILGYKASMQAEIGAFQLALKNAKLLREIVKDSTLAKPDAVFANIYFRMDSLKMAKVHADRANKLDPRNLDASRLKTRIDKALDDLD